MKTFTNLAQWASKCASLSTSNRNRYYLFTIIMLLTLGVGNAWAETATLSISSGVTANSQLTDNVQGKWDVTSDGTYTSNKSYIQVGTNKTTVSYLKLSSTSYSTKKIEKIQVWATSKASTKVTTKVYVGGNLLGTSSAYTSQTAASGGTEFSVTNPNNYTGDILIEISRPSAANGAIYFNKAIVTYTEAGSTQPTLSSIEILGDLTKKTYEEGDELDLAGLTVNAIYDDASTKVVTNDVEWSYTPNPLTQGTTSVDITASYKEKTFTKTIIDLIVNEHVVTSGTYGLLLNNVFFGTTAGSNVSSFPVSAKQDDITVTLNGSGTKTRTDAANVRMYSGNTLTFAVPAGYVIKSIVFTEPNSSKQWDGSITVNTGTYTDGTKTWTGSAQEVTYTFGAQNRIATASVTYAADVKYALNITTPSNGTLVVKEGETEVTSGATFSEGTKLSVVADPAQGYKLDGVTVVDELSNDVTTDVYADGVLTMPAYNVTISAAFSVNEKPAATLTLSKNGVTEDITGYKQDDKVTLPSITSDCVKEFVGWSADPNRATEPEYAPGASYTLASTSQTLYAVYATVEGGGETTSEDIFENNGTYNDTDPATIDWTLQNVVSIVQEQASSTSPVSNSYIQDPRWYKSHVITITPSVNITKIVTKAQSAAYATALATSTFTNATATAEDDVVTITPTNGSEVITVTMGAQARLYTLVVTYGTSATYSNYSTTCSAALANPTFSLAEGKYTEAKSVEIEYTEGTVYYTMDGTEPTASSTQYTGAIALNDCGEYTIKAIAISADSQSDVVSATYTIKLPLTNSQAAPYTEAEAIAVYDGDCYDNQDVYVKGTVKTATFYNSGTYTITLTNGFQFYKFYKDGSKATFTDGEINIGDVLVACGKLSKHNTTYQLAEGCYLVEHTPYEGEKTDISNTEATAYTVDQAFALIADVSSDLTKEVYVKGLVAVAPTSNPTADGQMTYKISDNGENTGNVLTVYLGLNLNGEKFTSKNDVQQGDYVVVKGKLLDYNSTYELNKGNQLVQHVKAATISIADITMEVGETKTIAATITPAAAETAVVYTIKENTANAISLSGNTITADAVGTATITATIATAEGEYMGKTVEFKVKVNAKSTKDKVVILAEYNGQWYAMKAEAVAGKTGQLTAIPVTYVDGKLYDVQDKATIEWQRAVVDDKTTFVNNSKYLKGSSTDLSLETTSCDWTWNATDGYYTTGNNRTFVYRDGYNFKNYAASNAIDQVEGYSELPVVTAPVYVTSEVALTGQFSTGKYEYAQFAPGNLQYNVGSSTWAFAANQYDVIGEDNINLGNPNFTGTIDMFGWSADGKFGVNPSNKNEDYTGEFQDWGKLFPVEDNYSTLSADQWDYLLFQRDKASSLKQIAKINGVVGILLFPDDWTGMPEGCTVDTKTETEFTDDEGTIIIENYEYTLEQWAKIEDKGAVFLPGAGRRTGGYGNKINYSQVEETNSANLNDGFYRWQDYTNYVPYYWTSTKVADNNVKYLTTYHVVSQDPLEYGVGYAHVGWGEYARYGQSVRLAKVTSTLIEIGGGDNSDVIDANGGETVNVKVNRTFTANDGYYTICLPFDLAAEKIGKAYQIQAITEHVAGEGINVVFTEVTTLAAGQPYLLLPSKDLENPIFEGVTIVNTTGDAAPTVSGEGINIAFTGIINGGGNTNGTSEYYVGNGGYLYNGETAKLGLRAFFTITDNNGNPAKVRARVVVGENTTTGLDNITNDENTTIKVIENGQLIIIRNGEKFNAQGQRL